MSYADSVINQYEATVDDEYQRMLLHQSSTVAFTAMMWLCYFLSLVLIWAIPGRDMEIAAIVMVFVPALGQLIGQGWLRRRVPLPRVIWPRTREIVVLAVVLVLWIIGIARSRSIGGSEFVGYLSGAVVGAGAGIVIVLFVFKIVYPKLRNRDQRRLDRELGDD